MPEAQSPPYPLSSIRFEVDLGDGTPASFSEVSGLNVETEMTEYRGGMDKLTVLKVPGLMKYSNVTLKRGIMAKNNGFFDWWKLNNDGKHDMKQVTIKLMNEAGEATVTWVLENAWPVKVEGPSLNAKGNEIAIESLELCHEGVKITNG